jgi:hypothetical protein
MICTDAVGELTVTLGLRTANKDERTNSLLHIMQERPVVIMDTVKLQQQENYFQASCRSVARAQEQQ